MVAPVTTSVPSERLSFPLLRAAPLPIDTVSPLVTRMDTGAGVLPMPTVVLTIVLVPPSVTVRSESESPISSAPLPVMFELMVRDSGVPVPEMFKVLLLMSSAMSSPSMVRSSVPPDSKRLVVPVLVSVTAPDVSVIVWAPVSPVKFRAFEPAAARNEPVPLSLVFVMLSARAGAIISGTKERLPPVRAVASSAARRTARALGNDI